MDGHRRSMSLTRSPGKKKPSENGGSDSSRRPPVTRSPSLGGERTVKRLRLCKALTMPENTTVHEACRRMAARRVDAALLTDSNTLLCGILTDKDIATRVIATGLKLEDTPVSKVMTQNPIFVLSDTLAVEALQKMVQGKFRHLPIVENGEVIALLDIAKCLYDAIARMERTAEKGKAIAAAVEGVEKHWGTSVAGVCIGELLKGLIHSLKLSESGCLGLLCQPLFLGIQISPMESVLTATRKMLEVQISSAVVTVQNKPQGILTSSDILMRVIAKNLSPNSTPVEKVMTPNPECATVDTAILDALHTMHNGKFLHLPVVDRDGKIVSIVDVIHITHAAIATVESTGGVGNEATISMMQKFWDSAMALGPSDDDDDARSEISIKIASEGTDMVGSPDPSSSIPTTFAFKLEDRKGRMHRFNCDTRSLTYLITSILRRVGDDIDRNHLPQILYEDEDRDKVILASDSDLAAAVDHARLAGWKGLRLYLDYTGGGRKKRGRSGSMDYANMDAWASAYSAVAAGAALIAGLGVIAYLKRSGS
ncbi:CBS domain-containing protein CBSCBSPB5-like isoform X2 [Elaeis guineensis]|uniref:CBS domain-containing protein CBSCBSPB5 isoform X1 n=1 Tax=Elaeis guineensis var. tenera TaxID=51953 RepID=A0A6J0PDE8_ELAGV|nr:CBS domain-containing protein CBSCBSPB5 isoform X1 [Elaeis guineensis]